jgi:hypothetical protein
MILTLLLLVYSYQIQLINTCLIRYSPYIFRSYKSPNSASKSFCEMSPLRKRFAIFSSRASSSQSLSLSSFTASSSPSSRCLLPIDCSVGTMAFATACDFSHLAFSFFFSLLLSFSSFCSAFSLQAIFFSFFSAFAAWRRSRSRPPSFAASASAAIRLASCA